MNVIPIIGKGDSLTFDEIIKCKGDIMNNCARLNIKLFDVYGALNVKDL